MPKGMDIETVKGIMPMVGGVLGLGGVATIVISAFVIMRHKWAWITSLVFDILWVAFDLFVLVQSPASGIIYLGISGFLIIALVVGRGALR
jgi:hypothetical protein